MANPLEEQSLYPGERETALGIPSSEDVAPGVVAENEPLQGGPVPLSSLEDLASLLHCTPEEIQSAVAALGTDEAHARHVLESLAPTYLAIKGRFESRKRGAATGAFCVVAEGRSGVERDRIVWAGVQNLPQGFSVDAGWESVRTALLGIAVFPDRILLRKVDQALGPLLSPTELNVLFSTPERLSFFAARFKEALADVFRVDFVLEVRMERFHRLRFEEVFPPAESPPGENIADILPSESEEALQIFCTPVIDPARGTPVNALRLGDEVEVAFEKAVGFAKYIGRLLERSGRTPAFPVSHIHILPSGDYYVRLEIAAGIHGVMKLPPTYRIRRSLPRRRGVFPFGRVDLGIFLEGLALITSLLLVGLALVYLLLK